MKHNNKKIAPNKASGFSLVELMVVIAIIGILAGIVYTNFSAAQALARDEARKVTLKEVQLAIEFYKAQNGRYPAACRGANNWSGGLSGSYACSGSTPYIVGLTPDFISELPYDSRAGASQGYIYRVNADGSSYKLLAHASVEAQLVESYSNEFARCPRSFGSSYCGSSPTPVTYAVYSSGAESW